MKMSRSHRNTRVVSSDFSIERILAPDDAKSIPSAKHVGKSTSEDSNTRLVGSSDVVGSGYTYEPESPIRRPDISCVNEVTVPSIHGNVVNRDALTGSLNLDKRELPWLQCTRYRPPKLPRKSPGGKSAKRRPGAHPRIPFTTIQIQLLEDKYRSTPYLSRRDVLQLSATLRLPQSRVKIWFQNRRARDRREIGVSGGNVTISSSEASSLHESSYSRIEKTAESLMTR